MAGVEQAPAAAPSPARGPDASSAIKKPDVQRNVKEASLNAGLLATLLMSAI